MRVAIISDIHDNVWNLRSVLEAVKDADALVCCGDLCAPFIVARIAEGFANRPIHIVFGNNDGDMYRITQAALQFPHVHLHGELYCGELGDRTVIATHYDTVAGVLDPLEADLICYGHDHQHTIDSRENCWILNPGAVMGYTPVGSREVPVSYAIYDTELHHADIWQIGIGNRCAGDPSPL